MKLIKYTTFLFSLLVALTYQQVEAQQKGVITGKVIDESGAPLEFANVGIRKISLGGVTDENGSFVIQNVPLGTHSLTASLIGFEMQQTKIEVTGANLSPSYNFVLSESAASLGEVVVSGTMKEVSKLDSPVPVEVYSANFFRSNPTPSVFESLQNVNGVRPQINCNVCNTGDIHINGLEGPYTMVLIDGMPIVSGLSSVYGLTGIPQALIERIEIVKGPASTLYGSEAVGGLINIITKKPASAPLVSADVFSTDWGDVNTDLGLRYNLTEKTQGLLGINYFNYQNPIDKNGDGFTDVTLQNRISIFNKFNFDRKSGKDFSVAGRYVYEDRWGGEMDWTSEYRGGDEIYAESIYTNRWEMFGVYQLPVDELINFQFSTNGHSQNSVYGDSPYIADQYIGFGQLTWNKPLKEHDLLFGMAYRYTFYDDNTPATTDANNLNEPSITHLPGAFLQDEITFNDNHKILMGMRYDYNSLHGSIFSPRINYKWTSDNRNNVVRMSVGNGYRVANVFTEDHAALTGAREVVFDGELAPETSWNANLNIVKKIYTSSQVFISLDGSAFYTYFNNAILPDYETDPNKIIYGNLDGHAVSKGASLNVEMSWVNGLNIIAGGTLMDVSVTENDVTYRQLLTERFSGVWSIGYTIPSIALTVDYTGNLYGPMRLPLLGALDDRPGYSPWYSLQNVQLSKRLTSKWEVYGGVKNLLNFTPAANSIARAFDPFDRNVVFDGGGQVVPTPENPTALTFDPSYVYAPNQGRRAFLGVRFTID
ncbi:TonB-dependent receptor [Cyclobacterium qasimii]|uniref:TonB-dependent receptor n=2 Tax=Cyclobacterium qasimii TaxID=1350429 RepID=S7WM35_9BACT|nr:TonB-dependent receptor [Cyclobacterium qasimii]EPR65243.1 TonB-dependent receptor [Cyclobacterium qasimii M12-11B]GEO21948.1 TonB-dependent receptor [Cyclobacterium qasimii]